MRLLGRVSFVAVAMTVAVPAAPAWAHVSLLQATPQPGSVITTPVPEVSLLFSEPVRAEFTTVLVAGADGESYADGGPRVVGATVNQPVRALPAGAIRVAWRTVSRDGHPVEGEFRFTVAAAAGPEPADAGAYRASAGPSTGELPARLSHVDSPGCGLRQAAWLLVGGFAILVGGAFLWLRARRRDAAR